MRTTRRTGVLAVAASLALTAIALPTTGMAAGILPDNNVRAALVPAVVAAPAPLELVPAGKLVLSTTDGTPGSGSVTRFDVNGTQVGSTQSITESGTESCKTLGTNGALLTFDGVLNTTPGKPVGFSKGSIGVKETSSETFCNQIDTTSPNTWFTRKFVPETLVLALPSSGLSDPDFGALKATSASLDVELLNKDSRILVTASLGGAPQAYYELRTGAFQTAATPLVSTTLPYQAFPLSGSPTPAVGPNIQWPIGDGIDGVTFDSLSIRAYNGAVSLEGKADSDSTAATSIDLGYVAPDVLTCGETLTSTSGTASVQYLQGATPAACAAGFSAVLSGTDDEVRFLKPLNLSPDAQFILDIDWSVAVPSSLSVPGTTVNFKNSDLPADDKAIGWCQVATYDVDGNLTGAAIGDDLEPDPLMGVQYACVGKQTTMIKDGKLAINEQIFLVGDVALRK